MEIVLINGSPRENGASSTIAHNLTSKLEENGNVIKKYNLNELNIHGCQECFYCRKNKIDICAMKDDLSEILEIVKKTDVLIISTPVFYADISAQLKCFIDRTWSYFGKTGVSSNHLPRNRSLVFIQSYGYPDSNIYDALYEKYKVYFKMFGFDKCYLIKAYGPQYHNPNIMNEHEVKRNIEDISYKIMNS